MKIQVNSDKNVVIDSQTTRLLKEEVNRVLERFIDKLTRVEIHLSDVNGPKPGKHDTLCLLEARPAGHQPVTVSMKAASVEAALRGSLPKLRRALETLFGRLGAVSTSASRANAGLPTPRRTGSKSISKRAVAAAPNPRKTSAVKKTATKQAAPKKAATKKVAKGSGRPVKKKAIYQARRKSSPKR
jgi:hypothetical protein